MKSVFGIKVGRFVSICLLSGVYIIGFMPSLVRQYVMFRDKLPDNHPFASDKLRFGDLYGISSLPAFRLPYQNHTTQLNSSVIGTGQPYNLCVVGDSYKGVALLHPPAFGHVVTLTLGEVDSVALGYVPVPMPGVRSFLVIETAERYVRGRFSNNAPVSVAKVPPPSLCILIG